MKDKKRMIVIVAIVLVTFTCICGFKYRDLIKANINKASDKVVTEEKTEEKTEEETINNIELAQIRNICELSAVECEFTNIAKSVKEPGTGLKHLGERRRKFWIKYKVKVRISYNLNEVKMTQNGDKISIYLPDPIVSSSIIKDSWNKDSYIIEKDKKIQKNPITAGDQTNAVNSSCNDIEEEVRNNTSLIASADQQARVLIENYINQIGKIEGIDYKIIWEDEKGDISSVDNSEAKSECAALE